MGYANWTLFAGPVATWAVYESMEVEGPFFVVALCAFAMGMGAVVYFVQRRRYIRIFDLVKNDCEAVG